MSDDIGQFLVLLGYAAILVTLVRSGSAGGTLVTDVGTAMASIINAATGGGSSSGGSTA